ncbi:hypothetical protein AXF42_Ash000984 [Apostasia shenzhenica]|uniref:Light-harvesting complex-like protein 3 isotype 1, chloroplastic n=1 Tax=Apostasia shenzhenica TaxID=1088818 RepID=A0A2I0ATL9_9ASPA|nr:hypothetical protein AXF42_Ash000984 [Apostasia shenzhenica]
MASSMPPSLPSIFSTFSAKTHQRHPHGILLSVCHRNLPSLFVCRSVDDGSEAAAVEEKKVESAANTAAAKVENKAEVKEEEDEPLGSSNGAAAAKLEPSAFKDPRWVRGTWDLSQFVRDGNTDWDAVIDAEAGRRKWLEGNPQASSNDEPVLFDTSIIPWWAWVKRYHLPEAELLNGRAAMVGFFTAYFVDSLTGIGLVNQMGNFFCKTLLFVAVAGVLLIRKNEDIEKLKKLIEETTFYDKQWRATWQDDNKGDSRNG